MRRKTNLQNLKTDIRNMKEGDKLHRLLRRELSKIEWFQLKHCIVWLKDTVENLQRHQPEYKIIKNGLTKLGYWRLKARGNPKEGYRRGFGKRRTK